MDVMIDESMVALGIKSVVLGFAYNIDPQAELSDSFLQKQKKMEAWALSCDVYEVGSHPITQGYADMLQGVGRSIKKYPPTVPAFIKNIQRRGSIPHINSVIDIYNVESLYSLLAIGGHDLDKITAPLVFTVNKEEGVFLPISSTEKTVAKTDFVYRDRKGIVAWLGVRDGEQYKFDDGTKNAVFIIQGNEHTSVDVRLEALRRIRDDLAQCMPHMEFETRVVNAG